MYELRLVNVIASNLEVGDSMAVGIGIKDEYIAGKMDICIVRDDDQTIVEKALKISLPPKGAVLFIKEPCSFDEIMAVVVLQLRLKGYEVGKLRRSVAEAKSQQWLVDMISYTWLVVSEKIKAIQEFLVFGV